MHSLSSMMVQHFQVGSASLMRPLFKRVLSARSAKLQIMKLVWPVRAGQDAGVHAIAQVAHFETNVERSKRSWILGINANLPASIVIKNIITVDEDFHARFSARARSYRYMIINQPTRSALLAQRATWERLPLNDSLMSAAAECLIGKHDFTSFRALACQAHSPVREIYSLRVAREGSLVTIDVRANGFLHHMVRNLAGVLMSIGRCEHDVNWAREVLEARDRALAGVTAPAQGLYFMAVGL